MFGLLFVAKNGYKHQSCWMILSGSSKICHRNAVYVYKTTHFSSYDFSLLCFRVCRQLQSILFCDLEKFPLFVRATHSPWMEFNSALMKKFVLVFFLLFFCSSVFISVLFNAGYKMLRPWHTQNDVVTKVAYCTWMHACTLAADGLIWFGFFICVCVHTRFISWMTRYTDDQIVIDIKMRIIKRGSSCHWQFAT